MATQGTPQKQQEALARLDLAARQGRAVWDMAVIAQRAMDAAVAAARRAGVAEEVIASYKLPAGQELIRRTGEEET
jgi:hypothetical protein